MGFVTDWLPQRMICDALVVCESVMMMMLLMLLLLVYTD